MNNNFFNKVEIQNFKSIEQINFDCKRINVFVGKPNVGKSCIIEALSLLANPDLLHSQSLKEIVNFEKYHNLIYNHNVLSDIIVKTDKSIASIIYHNNFNYWISNYQEFMKGFDYYLKSNYLFNSTEDLNSEIIKRTKNYELIFSNLLIDDIFNKYLIKENKNSSNTGFTMPYKFKVNTDYSNMENLILQIPNGNNLFWILSQSDLLQDELAKYLEQYNLELVYDSGKNSFFSQKKMKKNVVVQIPYSMIADTLQRMIYYTAAIYSNENSILLFEEPEVNSFPPYISELANKILLSESNQFFITTHSPYLLTTLLESSTDEVMLNVVGYKDGKTVIKQISDEEIKELLSFDSDIFLNIDRYI